MSDSETVQETLDDAIEAAGGASKSRKLIAIAVVFVAVLINLGLAYAIIPSAEDIEAQKRIMAGMPSEEDAGSESEVGDSSEEQAVADETTVEETLGEFNISAFQPLSSTTIRIDFNLVGVVEAEAVGAFREQYDKHENRIREQILIIMRSADIDDLSEAGLGLIKRRILDKTNRLLGQPYLQSVVFSNFSFVEQ